MQHVSHCRQNSERHLAGVAAAQVFTVRWREVVKTNVATYGMQKAAEIL